MEFMKTSYFLFFARKFSRILKKCKIENGEKKGKNKKEKKRKERKNTVFHKKTMEKCKNPMENSEKIRKRIFENHFFNTFFQRVWKKAKAEKKCKNQSGQTSFSRKKHEGTYSIGRDWQQIFRSSWNYGFLFPYRISDWKSPNPDPSSSES